MKEFIGVSRNIYFTYDDEAKALHPGCELILMVSEPAPTVDEDGNLKARRNLSDLRLVIDRKGLAMLATYCTETLKQIGEIGKAEVIRSEEQKGEFKNEL